MLARAIARAVRDAVVSEARRSAAVETMKVTAIDAETGALSVRPGGAQAGYTGISNAIPSRNDSLDVGESVLTLKVGASHGAVTKLVRSPFQEGEESTTTV